jgi:CubicO group peptidase (beta-lactamase class C family)
LADTAGDAINLLRDKPVESAPDSRWSYNQTNYMLLQMLLEKVSGRRFELIVLTNLIGADPPSMVTEIARRYLADSP